MQTIFGFIANPKEHIFMKPKVTKEAAKNYEYELAYKSQPNWDTYHNLLNFAKQMKKGVIAADIHAAITGLAVSGGSETRSKPVGTVFLSVLYKGQPHTLTNHFCRSPLDIRKKACEGLYEMIMDVIGKT